jgi:transcriptional regulator with XRE-family HTH domain
MAEATGEPLSKYLGRQLRRLREERGIRQEDIAGQFHELGLKWDRTTVASFETGRRALRLEEVLLCCAAYDVSLAEVLQSEPETWVQVGSRRISAYLVAKIVSSQSPVTLPLEVAAHAHPAPPTEAERRAAKQLGTGVPALIVASEDLWGRRLDSERDRRTAENSSGGDVRALRGHVTRQLIEELGATLPRRRPHRGG